MKIFSVGLPQKPWLEQANHGCPPMGDDHEYGKRQVKEDIIFPLMYVLALVHKVALKMGNLGQIKCPLTMWVPWKSLNLHGALDWVVQNSL